MLHAHTVFYDQDVTMNKPRYDEGHNLSSFFDTLKTTRWGETRWARNTTIDDGYAYELSKYTTDPETLDEIKFNNEIWEDLYGPPEDYESDDDDDYDLDDDDDSSSSTDAEDPDYYSDDDPQWGERY